MLRLHTAARPLPVFLHPEQTPQEDCRNALQLLDAVSARFESLALIPRDVEFLDALHDAVELVEDAVEKIEHPPSKKRRLLRYFTGLCLVLALPLRAQVAPSVDLHHGEAVTQVQNLSRDVVSVTVEIFRDTATADRIGAPVAALISPAAFTLQPGESQTVRIRLAVPTRDLLRLVTTLVPVQSSMMQTVRLTLVTRVAAKLQEK